MQRRLVLFLTFKRECHKTWQQHLQLARYSDVSFFCLKCRLSTLQFKICACMITSSLDWDKTKFAVSCTLHCLYHLLPLASAKAHWFCFPFCRSQGRVSPWGCHPLPHPASTGAADGGGEGLSWSFKCQACCLWLFWKCKGSVLGTGLNFVMTVGLWYCHFFNP